MAYHDRYRGSRRRRRNRIKIILLVLLLLVVAGLAALFFLQDAVVFTSNGFRFPSSQQEQQTGKDPVDPDDIHLEIEAPQPGASDPLNPQQPEASQPSQPAPQPEPQPVIPEPPRKLEDFSIDDLLHFGEEEEEVQA